MSRFSTQSAPVYVLSVFLLSVYVRARVCVCTNTCCFIDLTVSCDIWYPTVIRIYNWYYFHTSYMEFCNHVFSLRPVTAAIFPCQTTDIPVNRSLDAAVYLDTSLEWVSFESPLEFPTWSIIKIQGNASSNVNHSCNLTSAQDMFLSPEQMGHSKLCYFSLQQ